jgi:hypothetical protein
VSGPQQRLLPYWARGALAAGTEAAECGPLIQLHDAASVRHALAGCDIIVVSFPPLRTSRAHVLWIVAFAVAVASTFSLLRVWSVDGNRWLEFQPGADTRSCIVNCRRGGQGGGHTCESWGNVGGEGLDA